MAKAGGLCTPLVYNLQFSKFLAAISTGKGFKVLTKGRREPERICQFFELDSFFDLRDKMLLLFFPNLNTTFAENGVIDQSFVSVAIYVIQVYGIQKCSPFLQGLPFLFPPPQFPDAACSQAFTALACVKR